MVKKAFAIVAIFFITLLPLSVAFASSSYYQLVVNGKGGYIGSAAQCYQGIGNNLSGSFNALRFSLNWNGTGSAPSVQARVQSYTNSGLSVGGTTDGTSVAQTISATAQTNYTFTFSSPITFNSSRYYCIGFTFTGSGGAQIRWWGDTVNNYLGDVVNSETCATGFGTFCTGGDVLRDAYFVVIGDASAPDASFSNLTTGTTIGDFRNWSVNVSGISPGDQINVIYGFDDLSSTFVFDHQDTITFQFPMATSPLLVPKSIPLNNLSTGTSAHWIAYLTITDSDGTSLFSGVGEEVFFTVNAGLTGFDGTNFAGTDYSIADFSSAATHGVSTSSCAYNNSTSSWTIAATYQVSCFLFKPTSMTDNFLTDQFNGFKGVFPFSIFYQSVATIQSAITGYGTSTTALSLTVALPALPGGVAPASSSITFSNGSTFSDLFGSSFTNSWYNLILMIGVVLFAWGIFSMIFH